jgi:hypothetical protein
MTREIAKDLQDALKPRGVAVRVDARPCVAMRGVEQEFRRRHRLRDRRHRADSALAEDFTPHAGRNGQPNHRRAECRQAR